MHRSPARIRVSLACAALAVLLAACGGAPGPATAPSDPAPDLFEALPTPLSAPAAVPAAPAPTTTASPPATSRAPAPTTAPRTRDAIARPAAPAEGAGAPIDPQWRPVSADEFDGAVLDDSMWNRYDSAGGFHTGYRKPEAITQSGGLARITARGDVSGGMGHRLGQLYGRWEFRARTDPGRGFGSAVLLWPDSENWPTDGEIDVMEVPGERRDLAHFILHWSAANQLHGTALPGDYTQWHTFAVEWLPDRITWFIDGVKQYETTDKQRIPTTPMHLTVQLDQGPKEGWIPPRDETTPPEVSLEVDWVRVYAPAV